MTRMTDDRLQYLLGGAECLASIENREIVSMIHEIQSLRRVADAAANDLSNGHEMPATEFALQDYDKEMPSCVSTSTAKSLQMKSRRSRR